MGSNNQEAARKDRQKLLAEEAEKERVARLAK
jgi:hypothetical protein